MTQDQIIELWLAGVYSLERTTELLMKLQIERMLYNADMTKFMKDKNYPLPPTTQTVQ